ncbi:MAG TPA: metallophosphoesterase [Rhodospirillaceae bacterium]|nr:metallophosphoesterase [Rhodospirillaceae bacterium]
MKLLFLGDIMGSAAREAVARQVPIWRQQWALDAVIVNAENAVNGKGVNRETVQLLLDAGVDCVTTGNHAFAVKGEIGCFEEFPTLLRPLNFLPKTPGKGSCVITTAKGQKILVINPIAQLFMTQQVNNPFFAVDNLLREYTLGGNVDAIFVDFHSEATSEVMAMAWHLDGRATAVIGTHTHMPTADTFILPDGCAYQSDAGMCGDYHSILGVRREQAMQRFLNSYIADKKMEPAKGPVTLCGVYLEIDDKSGKTTRAVPVRYGPHLIESLP